MREMELLPLPSLTLFFLVRERERETKKKLGRCSRENEEGRLEDYERRKRIERIEEWKKAMEVHPLSFSLSFPSPSFPSLRANGRPPLLGGEGSTRG